MKANIQHINVKKSSTDSNSTVYCLLSSTYYSRRSTALVLVVVLLALLAILGSTFILTSRLTLQSVKNRVGGNGGAGQVSSSETVNAMDAVIAMIQSTLAEDLWGNIDEKIEMPKEKDANAIKQQRLLGLPCDSTGISNYGGTGYAVLPTTVKNESWDAPWTASATDTAVYPYFNGTIWPNPQPTIPIDGDPWLASQDPTTGQRTNLFLLPWPATPNPIGWNNLLITPGLETLVADADGDGVKDSIWVIQKGKFPDDGNGFAKIKDCPGGIPADLPFGTSNDLTYRMAVRIVDTSGMVNVNTAWEFPTDIPNAATPNPNLFLGNTLSGATIYGNGTTTGVNLGKRGTSDLPGRVTANGTLSNLVRFQNYYTLRMENPISNDGGGTGGLNVTLPDSPFYKFSPLDLSNEMDLRYRWTGTSPVSTTLRKSFDITATNKSSLTAYSFTRNIRTLPFMDQNGNPLGTPPETGPIFSDPLTPGGNRQRMKNLDLAIQSLVYRIKSEEATPGAGTWPTFDNTGIRAREFVSVILSAFQTDQTVGNYADGQTDANYHTWQYIANLVDYLDNDEIPTAIDTAALAGPTDLNLPAVPAGPLSPFPPAGYVYGLEQHNVISEVVVTCTHIAPLISGPPVIPAQGTYTIQCEMHNPWANDLRKAQNVALYYWTPGNLQPINALPFWDSNNPTLVAGSDNKPASFQAVTGTFAIGPLPVSDNLGTWLTAGAAKLILVSTAEHGEPEDIFTIDFSELPQTDTGPNASLSYEKSIGSIWSKLANSHVTQLGNLNTLGDVNHAIGVLANCGGYSTVTTDHTHADTWCPQLALCPEIWNDAFIGGNHNYFAKVRNLADLSSVPYVGFVQNGTGETQGIGNWLYMQGHTDNTVRFDITDATAGNKGYVLADKLLNYYTIINRENNGYDDSSNPPTHVVNENPEEMRLPGLININTAPATALQALNNLVTPAIATQIIGGRPYRSLSDFARRINMVAPADTHLNGLNTDAVNIVQRVSIFSRIANLITVRSDTFVAYILIQTLDKTGAVVSEKREMALFDRSKCNEPPLSWDNSKWIVNPKYRLPSVVAKQTVE